MLDAAHVLNFGYLTAMKLTSLDCGPYVQSLIYLSFGGLPIICVYVVFLFFLTPTERAKATVISESIDTSTAYEWRATRRVDVRLSCRCTISLISFSCLGIPNCASPFRHGAGDETVELWGNDHCTDSWSFNAMRGNRACVRNVGGPEERGIEAFKLIYTKGGNEVSEQEAGIF